MAADGVTRYRHTDGSGKQQLNRATSGYRQAADRCGWSRVQCVSRRPSLRLRCTRRRGGRVRASCYLSRVRYADAEWMPHIV